MARKDFAFTVLDSNEEAETYQWYRRKHWESENFLVMETSDWGPDWKIFRSEEAVVGVTKDDCAQSFFIMGDAHDFEIYLEREPDNRHDPNAIKVMAAATVKGRRIVGRLGYLSRETAMALQNEAEIDARPHSVWLPYGDCRYGLRITVLVRSIAFRNRQDSGRIPPIPPRSRPVGRSDENVNAGSEGTRIGTRQRGKRRTLSIPGARHSSVRGFFATVLVIGCLGGIVLAGFAVVASRWPAPKTPRHAVPPASDSSRRDSGSDISRPTIEDKSILPATELIPATVPEQEAVVEKPELAANPRIRLWRDKSGSYTVLAEYRWHTPVKVCLIRVSDSKEIKVDLDRLSDDDVAWIKKQMKK